MSLSMEVKPKVVPVLDPAFCPAVLVNRRYREIVGASGAAQRMRIALEREDGLVCRYDVNVLPPDSETLDTTLRYVERHVKCLLWAVGGWRLVLSGPAVICDALRHRYGPQGDRAFDAEMMTTSYDRSFRVETVPPEEVPAPRQSGLPLGGHWEGCRIGFDLGASDYKVASVVDGRPVFSREIPWNPSVQSDPDYHYRHIVAGLREAASHLPRVDAIGGSSAGIYVNNRVKVASLFRAVPREVFRQRVTDMFVRMQQEWGVPLVVVNDGDVTALAGALSLGCKALLGTAMGSSQAGGYLDARGFITGQLNELAFVPVDFSPEAPVDDWSGDRGVGAQYFSQQAVNRLAPRVGISFPPDLPVPDRLKQVQRRCDEGDEAATRIFETIGVYLGYALAHYADYYDYRDVLVLGRVTSGRGGEIILRHAKTVLETEFQDLVDRLSLHVPDESTRRVGQAVAAASLPELPRGRTGGGGARCPCN